MSMESITILGFLFQIIEQAAALAQEKRLGKRKYHLSMLLDLLWLLENVEERLLRLYPVLQRVVKHGYEFSYMPWFGPDFGGGFEQHNDEEAGPLESAYTEQFGALLEYVMEFREKYQDYPELQGALRIFDAELRFDDIVSAEGLLIQTISTQAHQTALVQIPPLAKKLRDAIDSLRDLIREEYSFDDVFQAMEGRIETPHHGASIRQLRNQFFARIDPKIVEKMTTVREALEAAALQEEDAEDDTG